MNDLITVPRMTPEQFRDAIAGEFTSYNPTDMITLPQTPKTPHVPYTPPKPQITREEWLQCAMVIIKSEVFDKVLTTTDWADNTPWPHPLKVSVGFAPNTRAQNGILGVCCPPHMSAAGNSEIFITPHKADSLNILATLTHEMIHGSDGCKSGHRNWFAKVARLVGLVGPLTATTAGDELNVLFAQIVDSLGEIPHAELDIDGNYSQPGNPQTPGPDDKRPGISGKPKQKGSRMIKVTCNHCKWSFRTSQKNIDLMKSHECLSCGFNELLVQ